VASKTKNGQEQPSLGAREEGGLLEWMREKREYKKRKNSGNLFRVLIVET
jgi:hypothetical protein